jgi:endonuclease/exonuclease/phosphatase (EEP) superfamily protein YafD
MISALVALIRALVLTAAVLLGLAGVGTALAGLGGAFSNRLDTFSHFMPFWAGLALAGALLGAAVRSRFAFGLGAAGVLLACVLLVPELLSAVRQPRAPLAHPTLTVVQFNLWAANPQQARTARWILAQNADVLVLEEAYGGTEQIIDALRGRYPYITRCRRSPCSTVIMSRQAPTATGDMLRLPGERRHLSGAWATFQDSRGPYTVVGVHFGWPWPFGDHLAQRRLLIESVRRFPRDLLIITGDFNSTPWSYDLRSLERRLGLTRYSRGLPSWPARPGTSGPITPPFPVMPIDHVFAGPGWAQVRVTRGPRLGSDHYPLVAQFQPPAPPRNADAPR